MLSGWLFLPFLRFNGNCFFSDDEEKKSLTGHSRGDSETDSMAEYGDGDPGRFTEDGSFIGWS